MSIKEESCEDFVDLKDNKVSTMLEDDHTIEDELKYLEFLIVSRLELEEDLSNSKVDNYLPKLVRKSIKREVKFLARESQKLAVALLNKGVSNMVVANAVTNAGRTDRLDEYSIN